MLVLQLLLALAEEKTDICQLSLRPQAKMLDFSEHDANKQHNTEYEPLARAGVAMLVAPFHLSSSGESVGRWSVGRSAMAQSTARTAMVIANTSIRVLLSCL